MREAGFEPAHPEIKGLKSFDINRASRFALTLQSQTFFYIFGSFVFSFEVFLLKSGPNTHPRLHPLTVPTVSSLAMLPTIYTIIFFKLFYIT